MTKRLYPYADDVMLMKTNVVIQNALEDVADLTVVQPSITTESLNAFGKTTGDALANFIGLDKNEGLRSATSEVDNLTESGFKSLRLIKTLLEINFKNEVKEMMNHYGYNNYYGDVVNRKHEPTISLLSVVARNAEQLKEKFATKLLPVTPIDEVVKLAVELPQAETRQEQQKGASKPVTQEQRQALNDIYVRVMDICKLARVIYADDEIKKSRYIFKNLVATRKNSKSNGSEKDAENTTDLINEEE